MSNPLLSLLDIDYPLIQAPMAGVSTPALAAAVSNAGALGSLGLGASTVAQAEAMIVATRQLTDRPFNVNLFCHAPPRRDARREADWATTLRPHFARYGSTPPDSLSEIYQTFIGHAPMLELYCRHVVRSRVLAEEIDAFDRAWLADEDGLKRYDRLLGMAEREARAANALARSLRITRQSVIHPTVAGNANAREVRSRKPWELPAHDEG